MDVWGNQIESFEFLNLIIKRDSSNPINKSSFVIPSVNCKIFVPSESKIISFPSPGLKI